MNGAQAISSLMDAGIYTWAATARCGNLAFPQINEQANCAVDILSALDETAHFANVIMEAVDGCGGPQISDCAMAGSELAEELAAIGAATGEVLQECKSSFTGLELGKFNSQDLLRDPANQQPNGVIPAPPTKVQNDPNWNRPQELICAVDIKGAMNNLFKAGVDIASAKTHCSDGGLKCAYSSLGIMESLADVGRYIQGAVGHCLQPNAKMEGNYPIQCASAITRAIAKASGLAAAATKMTEKCASGASAPAPRGSTVSQVMVQPMYVNQGDGQRRPGTPYYVPPRLYGTDAKVQVPIFGGPVNFILAALLPITAVAAFVAGQRFRSRALSQEHAYVSFQLGSEEEASI
jgi:hypothetical protein